jgi:glycosyltransferase involved in cell wall biosynthesis
MDPHLSLVTPVHNGAGYIAENLREMIRALERLGQSFEIIVVCDGSSDGAPMLARALEDDRVRVLDYPDNVGKGHAILHGVAHAQGRLVGWLDSDLDVSPESIVHAARRFDDGPVDAVVGSKRHPDSRVRYPFLRRVYSAGYQLLVRVGPLVVVKRWAFDLEVLAVGAEFGFDRIDETPVQLEYRFTGSSINWRAVRLMLQDTLAIAYRLHVRHHYVRRFASLQRARMDEATAPAQRVEDLVP